MLAAGRTLDRYTVLAPIGEGGMAAVFRVQHNALGSIHALKILKVTGPSVRERLVHEGRTQATLAHPNIVTVTDLLDVDGATGLVMEYVDGPSLESWIESNRPPLEQALAIFRGILDGVARAHRAGLVHRDLKPGNVLLAKGDYGLVPKVTDFGLVKALADGGGETARTRSGMPMGTPSYMAPEQIRDARGVDQRADIFALGCILYELVCGRRAFTGDDTYAIFNAIMDARFIAPEAISPGLPAGVRAAIAGCLRVEREDRIADCAGLKSLLESSGPRVPASIGSTVTPRELPGTSSAVGAAVAAGVASRRPPAVQPPAPAPAEGTLAILPEWVDSHDSMLPGVQPAGPSAGETQSGDWMAAEPGVAPARRAGRPFLALSVVAALAAAAMIAVIALVGIAVLWRGDSPGSPGAPDPIASVPSVATAPAEAVPPAPAVAPPVAASEEAPGVEVDASRRATATTRATGRPAPRDPAVVAPEAISPVAEAEAEPAVPEETPTPVATTALGTIRVTGDATRVVLDGPNGRARPGPVVAGTYSVRATFADGSEAPGETFAVRAGQVVTLECSATFLICRVKR